MSTGRSVHERSYRALVLLYPRAFRLEYSDDLVQVFRDDIHDRGALRGWARALSDLALTVPVQHVEATVNQPSPSRSAQAALVLGGLAVIALVSMGRFVVVAVPAAAAAIALLYRHSKLPYREAVDDAGPAWWRLVFAGAAVLAGMGLAATYGPGFDWFPWNLRIFVFLASWAAMITGAALGLVRLGRRHRRRPAGSF